MIPVHLERRRTSVRSTKSEGASLFTSFKPNRLGQASFLSAVQGALGAISILGALKLLIMRDGLEAAGLWSLCMSIVAILRVADVFNSASLARLVAASDEGSLAKAETIDTVTIATIGYYVCAIALGISVAPAAIDEFVEPEQLEVANALIPWLVSSLFFLVLMTSQANALDGLHLADVRAKTYIGGQLLFCVLSVVLVSAHGIIGLAAAQAIQYATVTVVMRWFVRSGVNELSLWPRHFSQSVLADAFSYSSKLQFAAVPILIYEPIARILINAFGGLAVLAIYDLAYKICSYARLMMEAASRPLVPEFARKPANGIKSRSAAFAKAMRITFGSTIAIYLSIGIFSPIISVVMLGAVRWDFLVALLVLSGAWAVAGFALIPKLYARAKGVMRWNIASEWVVAITTIVSILIMDRLNLIPSSLVFAPALAIAVGNGLGFWGNMRATKVLN